MFVGSVSGLLLVQNVRTDIGQWMFVVDVGEVGDVGGVEGSL